MLKLSMKIKAFVLIAAASFLMAGCRHSSPLTSAEKARFSGMLRSGKVRVEFKKGVKLSSRQQVEVLAVAEQCGIRDPVSIQTRKMLLSGEAIILVESAGRGEQHNQTIDRLVVYDSDSTIPSGEKARSLQRIGRFWALADEKKTYGFRPYEFWGASIHVRVVPPVQPELADRIVRLIETRTFRAADPTWSVSSRLDYWSRAGFLPAVLSRNDKDGSFNVYFEMDGDLVGMVRCRFDGDEMVIDRAEADYRRF